MALIDKLIRKFPYFDGVLKRPVKNLLFTGVAVLLILNQWGLFTLSENVGKVLTVFLGLFAIWVWNPQRGI